MSGGRFEYKQYIITEIADQIEDVLYKQGKQIPREELYYDDGEKRYYYTYTKQVQVELRNAVHILRKAAIYAQRIDWLLSWDDSEESFLKRLKKELDE